MCLETMSCRSKNLKTDCRLRKTMTAESKVRWRSLRVFSEEEGAFRHYRYSAMQVTIRKYLRHVQRRRRLAKPSKIQRDAGKEEKMESAYEACVPYPPTGAMAPENTTQYLMSNAYEDMMADDIRTVQNQTSARLYDESMSPSSVYSVLDTCYESCLDFQQKDFEETFGSYCGALDGARPVGSAPEPCSAPSSGTNQTHPSSDIAADGENQVTPARPRGFDYGRGSVRPRRSVIK